MNCDHQSRGDWRFAKIQVVFANEVLARGFTKQQCTHNEVVMGLPVSLLGKFANVLASWGLPVCVANRVHKVKV